MFKRNQFISVFTVRQVRLRKGQALFGFSSLMSFHLVVLLFSHARHQLEIIKKNIRFH